MANKNARGPRQRLLAASPNGVELAGRLINTVPTPTRADAQVVSVYDGACHLGEVFRRAGRYEAVDANGCDLGVFASLAEAMRAFPDKGEA